MATEITITKDEFNNNYIVEIENGDFSPAFCKNINMAKEEAEWMRECYFDTYGHDSDWIEIIEK